MPAPRRASSPRCRRSGPNCAAPPSVTRHRRERPGEAAACAISPPLAPMVVRHCARLRGLAAHALARGGTVSVTGEQLHEELRVAAAAARVSIQKFARPLFSEPNWKLEQLRIAKHPTQLTIERVRALVAGLPIPPPRGRYIRDDRAIGLSRIEAEEAGIP